MGNLAAEDADGVVGDAQGGMGGDGGVRALPPCLRMVAPASAEPGPPEATAPFLPLAFQVACWASAEVGAASTPQGRREHGETAGDTFGAFPIPKVRD